MNEVIRKNVFLTLFLSFIIIFISSIFYRFNSPNLTLKVKTKVNNSQDTMAMVIDLMQKLKKDPNNIDVLKELGFVFMKMGNWNRALSFWTKILDIEPKDRMALSQAGYCYFQLQKYHKAVHLYEEVLKSDENNYIINYNLGVIYAKFLSQPNKAKIYFQKVLNSPDAESKLKQEVKDFLSHISN
ncbi:Tetratricopeptide repeat-containing protein [Desulfonauticus submarinus]|uniref:Tetratricopeptide repeat-containing protein n=1 Tax=Desulfonauticus submarinus TaxID=206665 RepID=A0A1H0AAL4_9BACT|nr:tetratricopeptide repeat protein [Desulfonauticus submarinus]SDN30314.1 Tetratricopeptide repeat-containing protein [Desulfonauticus submarinus]